MPIKEDAMTAYIIAHVHSTNFGPEIVEYLRRVDATLEPFAGVFRTHGNPSADTIEGDWKGDLIIIEFPTIEAARGWYESPAYLEIRNLRTDNTTADLILFESLPAGYRADSALAYLLPEQD
ncbi:DUF1330 domain-containing protein [Nocardia sp. NEAU-G5]|uniref:DUF1330 domain-containing protein n=3 Tax=Nocardiaceae TaxID=85025 RepID=A0ABS6BAX7_9NOCA|nr:DUF1330 domain-containing protein [Nocardia albiluteola]